MRIFVTLIALISISANFEMPMVRTPMPDGMPIVECPITVPNSTAPDEILNGPNYGEEALVAGVSENGILVARREEDSRGGWTKHGWVRHAEGQLRVEARPIGGQQTQGQFSADVPDGYGVSGFQVTSMSFPVEGCWEITGSIPGHSVTIVVWVVFVNDWLEPTGTPPDALRWHHFA